MKSLGAMAAAAAMMAAGAAQAGDVTVELAGVQARGGTVFVALQREGEFMKEGAAYGARVQAPAAGVLRVVLKDVAPGDYALSALHDVNGDAKMNLSPQYIPLEGWAMSRGDNLQAQPTFDQVKVTAPAEGTTLRANMIYYDGKVPAR